MTREIRIGRGCDTACSQAIQIVAGTSGASRGPSAILRATITISRWKRRGASRYAMRSKLPFQPRAFAW